MKNEMIIREVFERLEEHYGQTIMGQGWQGKPSWWQANTAVELMVGAILVQNTNWKNVDKALRNFGNNLNASYIIASTAEQLAEVIRPAGFQNQKAKKLKALFEWFEAYACSVTEARKLKTPRLRQTLLAINGIGPETADALLVYVFGKTSFVIDAYTRRIFARVGLTVPQQYDQFKALIEHSVPKHKLTYDYYHGLMVEHAQRYCLKKPQCTACPLSRLCQRVEVNP